MIKRYTIVEHSNGNGDISMEVREDESGQFVEYENIKHLLQNKSSNLNDRSCRDCECFYKIEEIKVERGISRKNNQFYMLALKLSGQRELLEKKAAELINKHGYLRALKITRSKNEK